MKEGKFGHNLKRSHLGILELLRGVPEEECLQLRSTSIRKLVKVGLVEKVEEEGFRDGYRLTEKGWDFLKE